MSKVTEYQQVAALLCKDIDAIALAVESKPELATGLVKKLKEGKDKVISDKEHRESRYNAAWSLINNYNT